jgi:hypothetical protein
MKPTTLFAKGGRTKNRNIMDEVDLFKEPYMHIWNYHREIPSLMCDNSK